MMAGPLDRRITWQRSTVTRDDLGQPVPVWATLFETWCGKVTLRPFALVAAGTEETTKEITQVVQIRKRPETPLAADRALFEGRTWAVHGIAEIGRGEGWEITLKSRLDTGQVEAT
jgi:head-tail adaptor